MDCKIIFLLPLLLLAGCIQVRPDSQEPGEAPAVREKAPGPAGAGSPLPSVILDRIARQSIRWEDLCLYPAPEQMWREDRFRQIRPDGALRPSDFRLKKTVRLSGRRVRVSFFFLPLRVGYDGRRVWDTRVDFTFAADRTEIEEIRMVSELTADSPPGVFRLTASACNAISAAVLKKLFALYLPGNIRTRERYRFCCPVNGTDAKFREHLRPRARIPELDPSEEYPGLPVPFEKGRYRSFDAGAFYYYAGIVLPVNEKEVWVFDTSIRYAGGETRGAFYKLKKGLIFWETVCEGAYDAPSRAVREKGSL